LYFAFKNIKQIHLSNRNRQATIFANAFHLLFIKTFIKISRIGAQIPGTLSNLFASFVLLLHSISNLSYTSDVGM
jgi:hypothetical protein